MRLVYCGLLEAVKGSAWVSGGEGVGGVGSDSCSIGSGESLAEFALLRQPCQLLATGFHCGAAGEVGRLVFGCVGGRLVGSVVRRGFSSLAASAAAPSEGMPGGCHTVWQMHGRVRLRDGRGWKRVSELWVWVQVQLWLRSLLLPIGSAYGSGWHGVNYRGGGKETFLRVGLRCSEYRAELEMVFC